MNNNFIIYDSPSGEVRVDVFVEEETVWLTQKGMGELFGVSKSTISEYLSNIFADKELEETSVVRNFRTTASDGKKYNTNYYNCKNIEKQGDLH
jgi:hypothetical protein